MAAAASTAAAATRGRAQARVIRGRGGPAVAGGQREQALNFPVVTLRTGDLGVAPYQELEIVAAAGAAVFVDRHVLIAD